MYPDNTNIYKTARAGAGLTQEQAAELLELSVESVKAYETGQRVPPDGTVRLMAKRYGTPGLALEHARATDELGLIPKSAAPRSLEQAALHLHRKRRELDAHEERLLEIAEDGCVDENEAEDFARIQSFVGSFVAACLEVQCCEGAKRERPTAGTVKRSRSRFGKPKNLDSSIVPQIPRNASKICAGSASVAESAGRAFITRPAGEAVIL